jgi:peptidyl-prolyl cis-trans isomerase B (cyclophilin B)
LWNLAKQKPAYAKLAQLAAATAGLPEQIMALDAADAAASDAEALHYVALLEAAQLNDKLNWLAKGEGVPERFVRVLPIRQRIAMALAYDADGKPRGDAIEKHPEWLTDPDPVIRAAAFASAGASGKKKWIKPLITALKKTRTERDPEPAIAILEAMDELTQSKEAHAEAELVLAEMLRNTLESKRLMVRRKTVELMHKLLREVHKRQLFGEQTGKSLADYQAIAARLAKGDGAIPMTLKTDKGDIKFVARRDLAPLTAENFARLATAGFYDNLIFHRVVPAFVIQGGDPLGSGVGGPGYYIRDEEGALPFGAGALGMASAGHDTAGSQFFFTAVPTPHLDERYTAFGRVADDASLAVIEAVVPGDHILSIRADAPAGGGK